MHGGWLCFGNRCIHVIGCLKQNQHGSRSTRFPFNYIIERKCEAGLMAVREVCCKLVVRDIYVRGKEKFDLLTKFVC